MIAHAPSYTKTLVTPLLMTALLAWVLVWSNGTAGTGSQEAPRLMAAKAARSLDNGCKMTKRGVPKKCGVLMGGGYGLNDDPASWEKTLGDNLGVRRTYFAANQVAGAVRTAKADLAKERVPWMSFKVPYSWSQMASGKGDAWAKDLAKQFKAVDGPVWIAFHHEPERDGDIQEWKRMQERLSPIIRKRARNVAFSVILMGYHEFYGDPKYAMSKIWPDTKVNIAGFDVYDHYGKNGQTKHTDFNAYYSKISSWASSKGVKWGIAETGVSHNGAVDKPNWFAQNYKLMKKHDGVALSYFNSSANSFQDWRLTTALKSNAYAKTFRSAPSM